MRLKTNGDKRLVNDEGDAEFGKVWISEHDITNVYSHSLLAKQGYRIVSDTLHDLAFCLQRKDGSWMRFVVEGFS